MKKTRRTKPTANKLSILHQLCNYIPGLVVNSQTWGGQESTQFHSLAVSMLYAQLTHSIGLNDVCDALGHHRGALSSIRGAEAPIWPCQKHLMGAEELFSLLASSEPLIQRVSSNH